MRTVLGIEIGQPVVEGVLSGGTSPDARPDLPAPSEAPVTERPWAALRPPTAFRAGVHRSPDRSLKGRCGRRPPVRS
jgi:hypothetical protein